MGELGSSQGVAAASLPVAIAANVSDAPAVLHEDITLKIAETRAEWSAAFQLVQNSYERSGLAEANRFGMRITPYHLLPTTEIFIAQLREDVICTVTLVIDGQLGLPMQSLYTQEIRERRSLGLRLAEVSCLADRRSDPRRFFPLFVALSRLMVQSARLRDVDQLLVTVHPRHARFYHRYMAFEVIGEEKAYPTVRNNPALPMCLDFARIDQEPPASYNQFFGERLPAAATQYRSMAVDDQQYFRSIAAELASYEAATNFGLSVGALPVADENVCARASG